MYNEVYDRHTGRCRTAATIGVALIIHFTLYINIGVALIIHYTFYIIHCLVVC